MPMLLGVRLLLGEARDIRLAVPVAAPEVTTVLALSNFAGSRWALRTGRAPQWRA